MFSKLAVVAALGFAAIAAAIPTGSGQCQTSEQYCCNSVQNASSPQATSILGLVGAVVGADIPVGLTCSPLSVVGLGGNSCKQQPVCCNGNSYKGAVVIGCSPINVNL